MAQSYANSGGSGDRTYLVLVQTTCHLGNAGLRSPVYLVNGGLANVIYFDSQVANQYFKFDFGQSRIVDESKWYQDTTATQGTWKFQGSNDDSTYTDIGTTFTLGGATPFQTITTLNGNTTPYRYLKLLQTAGSVNNGPFTQGIEFKIDALNTTIPQYANTYGAGDRTASLTLSQSLTTGNGNMFFGAASSPNPSLLPFVDGLNTSGLINYFSGELAVSGKWLQINFPDYRIIDEVRWWYSTDDQQATWKLQGSTDGTTWVDVGTSQLISGSFIGALFYSPGSQQLACFNFTGCHGNTTAYNHYRMLGVSGSASNNSSLTLYEIGFRILAGAAPSTAVPSLQVIT